MCLSLVDCPIFTTHDLLTVGEQYTSSTDNLAIFTHQDVELAVRDLRRKTDDFQDRIETTESSHQWTDEEEWETLEEGNVMSGVEDSHHNHSLLSCNMVGTDIPDMQLLNGSGCT